LDKTLGDTILNSVRQMLTQVFGGCPKRKVCSFYQTESITCISGPYLYCGKYRAIIEPKSKKEIIHGIG
jgi:hypothetical protein